MVFLAVLCLVLVHVLAANKQICDDTTVEKLRVIKEANEMIEKAKQEKHEEQTQFAAYKKFCDDTTDEKQHAIKEANEVMETLKADIEKDKTEGALCRSALSVCTRRKPGMPPSSTSECLPVTLQELSNYLGNCKEVSNEDVQGFAGGLRRFLLQKPGGVALVRLGECLPVTLKELYMDFDNCKEVSGEGLNGLAGGLQRMSLQSLLFV